MSHTVTVTAAGKTYQIPDIWILGYVQGNRLRGDEVTPADAVAWWIYQTDLEAQATA